MLNIQKTLDVGSPLRALLYYYNMCTVFYRMPCRGVFCCIASSIAQVFCFNGERKHIYKNLKTVQGVLAYNLWPHSKWIINIFFVKAY